ncbi:FAD-binding domain-containing protein [Aulographum hederae CBS 113979]|uniref:FAD-binding domain-containing protein n=1 Tax=Aulographum hederae CBS 113979 TaxID=1176131 RepID=A0A6G1HHL9_9PEZI|nr:FAD-binding domain-containing protein [Aulographum hederae CBS 113979]
MKGLSFFLAALQLAAALPHGPGGDDDDAPAAAAPEVPAAPIEPGTGSTPTDCRVLHTDKEWPAPDAWSKAVPDIAQSKISADGKELHPDYTLIAKSVEDVQNGVKFAKANNLRLTVINSGHDYLGRNDAPSGLRIDTSQLSGIKVSPSFTPSEKGMPAAGSGKTANVVQAANGTGAAVTFGVGLTTQELNDAIAPSNVFTMGAAHGEVKPAGGYGQMGGHGPFTSKFGLAADHVLEYKVVTPDGQLRVANKASNPDLFWALRGGGGSTFGVVVESTVQARPSPKISVLNWWMNATNQLIPGNGYWDAVAHMHSALPDLSEKGVMGYYFIYRASMKGIFQIPDSDDNAEELKKLWTPVLEKMQSFPGMKKAQIEQFQYGSFKEYYDARYGKLEEHGASEGSEGAMEGGEAAEGEADHAGMEGMGMAGQAPEQPAAGNQPTRPLANGINTRLSRRHGPGEEEGGEEMEGAMPMGIMPMDSRLLGRPALTSPQLSAALSEAIPKVPLGQLLGALVGGGKVMKPEDPDSAVNPAWRKAYVHLICTGAGQFTCDSLRRIAPDMGAYGNEASVANPDWKNAFWGSNYEKLSQIKDKYDPDMLFWASPGINADKMVAREGRVCKAGAGVNSAVQGPAGVAPKTDNENMSGGDSAGDLLANFPAPGTKELGM